MSFFSHSFFFLAWASGLHWFCRMAFSLFVSSVSQARAPSIEPDHMLNVKDSCIKLWQTAHNALVYGRGIGLWRKLGLH